MEIEIGKGVQAALGDRYRIEREIGRGGMATVYLAEDAKHQRMVALKILHAELAAAVGPKRFRREIAIASQLHHPHILPLLDSGDHPGGPLWFAMPYVDGESLRDRLERERQLPLTDALRITREVASALAYAHARGVIHRDVKPENILLSRDGLALLADFGVARDLINFPGTSSEHRLTDTGLSIGTLEYMSPEQASGRRDIDARSDVYSLGCVLYEMLAGEPPFTGATPQALVARRLVERPLPLRSVRDRIPDNLQEAVDIALARVPADRFASAAEFAMALEQVDRGGHEGDTDRLGGLHPDGGTRREDAGQGTGDAATERDRAIRSKSVAGRQRPAGSRARRLISGLAIAVVVAVASYFAWTSLRSGPAAGQPVRLAVMPFDASSDSVSGIFAGGITDAVRGKLAALPGLQVIARGSSLQYRKTSKTPQVIAGELGVQYLLTGQVRADSASADSAMRRVHVHSQLTQVREGAPPTVVWEAPLDAELANVFQVESGVATQVASALGVSIGAVQRQQLAEQPTRNADAYGAYLQGEARRSGANPVILRQRVQYYARAVALDSNFGLAWAALSVAHSGLFYNSTPTVAEATAAADALSRAQALIPGQPETQIALATYELGVHKDPVRARNAAEAGLATSPSNVELLYTAAASERASGQWDAALKHAQAAQLIDPRSVRARDALATTFLYLRHYRDAREGYERALSLDPQATGLYEFLALAGLGLGDTIAAHDALRRALDQIKDTAQVLAFFAGNNDLFWVLNDADQRRILRTSPGVFDGDRGFWAIVRAETYWLRGDTGRARRVADTARIEFANQLRESPGDGLVHTMHGLALAYLGHKSEAMQEGERGVALIPVRTNTITGLFPEQVLARIYVLIGEPDKAVVHLDTLLEMPSFISRARLRIDPNWTPLQGNAAFERLLADSARAVKTTAVSLKNP